MKPPPGGFFVGEKVVAVAKKNETSWTLSRRIEENYARQLRKVSERVTERLASAKTPDEIMRRLRAFQSDPEYIAYCEALKAFHGAELGDLKCTSYDSELLKHLHEVKPDKNYSLNDKELSVNKVPI